MWRVVVALVAMWLTGAAPAAGAAEPPQVDGRFRSPPTANPFRAFAWATLAVDPLPRATPAASAPAR